MSAWRLTERGYRFVSWTAVLVFLMMLGIAGWIEGLS